MYARPQVETAHASCHHCSDNNANSAASTANQTLRLTLAGTLAAHTTLAVWRTNPTDMFVKLADLTRRSTTKGSSSSSSFELLVEPESMYTVTSTSGQTKGLASTPVPASAAFPRAWSDDFEAYPVRGRARSSSSCRVSAASPSRVTPSARARTAPPLGATSRVEHPRRPHKALPVAQAEGLARFWADQCGSFQVLPSPGGAAGTQLLVQRTVEHPGTRRRAPLPLPHPLALAHPLPGAARASRGRWSSWDALGVLPSSTVNGIPAASARGGWGG